MLLLFMGNDGRKLLLHLIKHYRHLHQDVVAAAELQLLISSFLSPFYAWKQRFVSGQTSSDLQSSKSPSEFDEKSTTFWNCLRPND